MFLRLSSSQALKCCFEVRQRGQGVDATASTVFDAQSARLRQQSDTELRFRRSTPRQPEFIAANHFSDHPNAFLHADMIANADAITAAEREISEPRQGFRESGCPARRLEGVGIREEAG